MRVLSQILAPLVEADGGCLYLILAEEDRISLHLGGRFSGCPGNALVNEGFISPALRSVVPNCKVVVTSGTLVPEGATLIRPSGPDSEAAAGERDVRVAD